MTRENVPESVRRLIAESIDSIVELEAILLLRAHANQDWDAEQAGARLYVSVTVAAHILDALARRGFFTVVENRYRYDRANTEMETQVAALATAYATNLIAVTHLVHAKPTDSVRQFAQAFRFRKDK